MSNIKERITILLEAEPSFRDNLTGLIINFWMGEMQDNNMDMRHDITHFFAYYFEHLTPIDSITRIWRLVQMENPNLRGKLWDKRHGKAEIIKHEIVRGDLQTLLH